MLAEILQFLSQWLARDPARLAASLEQFVGHPAYGNTQLCQHLDRFALLLGAATANTYSASRPHDPALPRPANDTPDPYGLNVVRRLLPPGTCPYEAIGS